MNQSNQTTSTTTQHSQQEQEQQQQQQQLQPEIEFNNHHHHKELKLLSNQIINNNNNNNNISESDSESNQNQTKFKMNIQNQSSIISDLSIQSHHNKSQFIQRTTQIDLNKDNHTSIISLASSSSSTSSSSDEEAHTGTRDHHRPQIALRRSKYNALEPLRSIYRTAAKSFLHKEHLSVWVSLSEGLEKISSLLIKPSSDPEAEHQYLPWWTKDQIQAPISLSSGLNVTASEDHHQISSIDHRLDQELYELARKFRILQITFLASIHHSSSAANHQNSIHSTIQSQIEDHDSCFNSNYTHSLLKLLSLESDHLISTLWKMTIFNQRDLDSNQTDLNSSQSIRTISNQSDLDSDHPIDSVSLMNVHPSIVTAAALASIKLSAPRAGKKICEAWISSLNVGVLDYIEGLMRNNELHSETPLTGDHGVVILNPSFESPHKRGGSNIRYNYARLIEVYAVHILGSLDESQFAKEFVISQSSEAGGVLPMEIVKNVLNALELNQAQKIQTAHMIRLKHERLQQEWDKREAIQKVFNKPSHPSRPLPPSPLRQSVSDGKEERGATNKIRRGHRMIGSKVNGHHNLSPSSPTDEDSMVNEPSKNDWPKSSNGRSTTPNPTLSKARPESDLVLQPYLDHRQTTSSSTGFAALRNNLSRLLSNSSQQPNRNLTNTSSLRNLIISIKSLTSRPTAKLTLLGLVLLTIIKSLRRRTNLGVYPIWSLFQFVQWCLKKIIETFRMGTRLTYL